VPINSIRTRLLHPPKRDATIAALKTQAGIMRGQLAEMQAGQRPWLFAQKIELSGAITRDTNGIRIPLGFTIANSGHLPASIVYVNLSAFAAHPGNLTKYPALEHETCDRSMSYIGISVFPNFTTDPIGWTTYISNEDIADTTAHLPENFKVIVPLIIACVVYKDPSSIDHHTPYALTLVAVKDGRPCCVVPTDADELTTSQIIIQHSVWSGMPPD